MHIKKSLKIFVDAYLLNKEHQGTKTYIKELYKAFAESNTDITIYFACFSDGELEKEFEAYKNIRFIYFTQKSRVLRMFFEIPKLIKEHEFDFAHFQYVIPFVRSKKCKYIVTIHDILFNDFKEHFSFSYRLKRNFLFKNSAKKVDFLLTVSEYSKNKIQKLYQLQHKNVFITPNGVDKRYFDAYSKQESVNYIKRKYKTENYILYVSRIEPRKNQQALLSLFLKSEKEDLQLVFIGDESLNNKALENVLKTVTEEERNRIWFFKDICDSDLLDFYRAAKVFVYPSFAEGFGIPPIEAAALKIPVLCSNATAMNDFSFFKPFHIDVSDNVLFRSRLEELLLDKDEKRTEYIQNKIKKTYRWSTSAKVLTAVIRDN